MTEEIELSNIVEYLENNFAEAINTHDWNIEVETEKNYLGQRIDVNVSDDTTYSYGRKKKFFEVIETMSEKYGHLFVNQREKMNEYGEVYSFLPKKNVKVVKTEEVVKTVETTIAEPID